MTSTADQIDLKAASNYLGAELTGVLAAGAAS